MLPFGAKLENGIVNEGNVYRLKKVFKKMSEGKAVSIGFLGGSITEGAWSTSLDKRYAAKTSQWLRDYFKNDKIKETIAGIGATTSLLGLFRADRDLLFSKPELIFVDFTVNDFDEDENMPYEYESLIRKLLSLPNEPAVVMLAYCKKTGWNNEKTHAPIAKHYGIPYISYRDAYFPLVEKGAIRWEDISPDSVHPNDDGHAAAASLYGAFFEKIMAGEIGEDKPYTIREELCYGLELKNPRFITAENAIPYDMGGFVIEESPWRKVKAFSAKGKNKPLIFKVNARHIGVGYLHWGDNTFGSAKLKIDDKEYLLEGFFDVTWEGEMRAITLATNLENKEHTISIELMDEHHEKATGEKFMLTYLFLSE